MKFIILLSAVGTALSFAPHVVTVNSRTTMRSHSHQEIFDSEEEAAVDAHDLPDAGFEAAAMERAVMMAEDMLANQKHNLHAEQITEQVDPTQHFVGEIESFTHQETFDAEEAAAYDAHDVSDAGIEAAAMESAVFMAEELMRKKKP